MDGIRPYPLVEEVKSVLESMPKSFDPVKGMDKIHYPTLLSGEW